MRAAASPPRAAAARGSRGHSSGRWRSCSSLDQELSEQDVGDDALARVGEEDRAQELDDLELQDLDAVTGPDVGRDLGAEERDELVLDPAEERLRLVGARGPQLLDLDLA